MAAFFTRFAKRSFLLLHIGAALLFLLACFGSYLSPRHWWVVTFLGLGFPILLLTLIFFIFFWIIFKPRYVLVSLMAMGIGYKAIITFVTLRPLPDFIDKKQAGNIRLMHWNVARFIELSRNDNRGSRTRQKMMDLIRKENADILCLQEFFQSTDPRFYNNLKYITEELGYPYYYFGGNRDGDQQWYGQAIFSRFPIVDSSKIYFPRPALRETLIQADILINTDTVRVMTTHLQSVQFKKEDYQSIEEIKERDDSLIQNSKNIFSKLRVASRRRAIQAEMVRAQIEKSPYPVILTGDFNDIPNSYTYHTISKGLQDAFLEKGFGVGRTYSGISPTLRIDYILTSKNFSVEQFQRLVRELSDHYPLVADLKLDQQAMTSRISQ